MTVIATFSPNQYAVLIGDILLSGDEANSPSISIPTIGPATNVFPEGAGWTFVGLRQKVVILAPHCVIAWAGDYLAARMVVKDLRRFAVEGTLNYANLEAYFTNLDKEIADRGVSFVGSIRDAKGIRQFGYDCLVTTGKVIGEMRIAGSGAQSVADLAISLAPGQPPPNVELNPLQYAMGITLSMLGALLSNEIATGTNLIEYFGGGYEIVTEVEGRFEKIDDITYLFWRANYDALGIALFFPSKIIKQCYSEDLLIIRTASIDGIDQESGSTTGADSLFVISPPDSAAKDFDLAKSAVPPLSSKFQCHCIEVHCDGRREILLLLDYSYKKESKSFKIIDSGLDAKFSVSKEFIERISDSIKSKFSQAQ